MAFAFGEIRLSYDDFWVMTPREYWNTCNGHNERVKRDFQTSWEQARWVAHIIVNVNLPKDKQIAPASLTKFPWEEGGADGSDRKTDIEKIQEYRDFIKGRR